MAFNFASVSKLSVVTLESGKFYSHLAYSFKSILGV